MNGQLYSCWYHYSHLRIVLALLALVGSYCVAVKTAHAQDKPLTYPDITTALNTKLPNRSFKTKADLIEFLIEQVRERGVDKPLDESREDDLRQAGATDELITVIRAKSEMLTQVPALPMKFSVESRRNSMGMELVWIPPGEFLMGSENGDSDEEPVRRVIFRDGFWMGKYEVTQAEYEAVIGTRPSDTKNCPTCPVEMVSWNDAKAFVARLNASNDGLTYGLPSEAQWEYAARGGTTSDFYGNLDRIAWYKDNSGGTTHPVGKKEANKFGLYDMSGNVWEWCEDIYKNGYAGMSPDGSANTSVGDKNLRVLRGGSWYLGPLLARSANRHSDSHDNRYGRFGFRVVARAK